MAHVSEPHRSQRVGRPKRTSASRLSVRQRVTYWGCGLVVFALLVAFGSYVGFNLLNAASNSSGAAVTMANFLDSVHEANYPLAYTYLSPAITLRLSSNQFTEQAQNDDLCFGRVTDYKLVDNGTIYQETNQSYSYNYTLTRTKSKQSYQLRFMLQQDPNAGNAWKITDYSNDLGPSGQSTSGCK
jgi:hypothetical protein